MLLALDQCPKDVLVMGNIDPVSMFKMASSRVLYGATKDLLLRTANYPNFVLSSGCDTPRVPFEIIEMFIKALADFNRGMYD